VGDKYRQRQHDYQVLRIPCWMLMTLLAAPAARYAWVLLKRRRWMKRGRCAACGYDLRASSGRCPECGWRMREHPCTPFVARSASLSPHQV
jgi:hypothetical protein